MGERVVLDVAGGVAQCLELGQGVGRRAAADDEVLLHVPHRLLQRRVVKSLVGVRLKRER